MAATILDVAGNIQKPVKNRIKDAFKVNTKLDFNNKFRTEHDCHEYLANMRWPDGFVCPRCGNPKGYYLKTRKKYECSECKYQVSATAGTVFHKTKISLQREKIPAALDAIEEYFARQDGEKPVCSRMDGLRLDWPNAWLLIRGSNTEPIVRAIAEADTLDEAKRLCALAGAVVGEQ